MQSGEPVIVGKRHHLLYKQSIEVIKPYVPARVLLLKRLKLCKRGMNGRGIKQGASEERLEKVWSGLIIITDRI